MDECDGILLSGPARRRRLLLFDLRRLGFGFRRLGFGFRRRLGGCCSDGPMAQGEGEGTGGGLVAALAWEGEWWGREAG